MELEKILEANEIIKQILYNIIIGEEYLYDYVDEEDLQELIDSGGVEVVGYKFDRNKNEIIATVTYEDEVSEIGIEIVELSISIDKVKEYI